jgi:hypothetical protein
VGYGGVGRIGGRGRGRNDEGYFKGCNVKCREFSALAYDFTRDCGGCNCVFSLFGLKSLESWVVGWNLLKFLVP